MKKALVLLLVLAIMLTGFYGKAKAITGASITASPNTAGSTAMYTISFSLSNPIPAGGFINVLFPSAFYVPTTISPASVLVTGAQPTNVTVSGNLITIYPSQPGGLSGGYNYMYIYNSSGIKNPTAGGTYTITLSTSVSGEASAYPQVSIASAVSNVTVNVNPLNVGSAADYSILFNPNIALTQNVDYIYVEFPAGSTIPSDIQNKYIQVNGQPCSYGSVSIVSGTKIQIRTPVPLTATYNASIFIPQSVGILNPPTAGTYTIKVSTSKETTPVDSNPYTLVGSNITNLYVSVSPPSAGVVANYTIQFMTGSSGALTTTSDWIKIVFPSGTVVPTNTSAGYISINGRSCTSRYVSGTTLTAYIPSTLNIPNSSWVYVSISDSFGIVNPTTTGGYYLKVSTSKDTIPATSNTYSIITSPPDFTISATPSSQTVNRGDSTTFTVTLTSQNGFNSSVSLSASGLPSGATASFSPSSLIPTGSSTLIVSTSASTPTGDYIITITASGGGVMHTAQVSLNVTSSTPPIWPMFRYNAQHTGRCTYDTSGNSGQLKWRYQTGSKVYSSPAVGLDGTIYVGSDDGYLYAIYPDGNQKWKYQINSAVRSSPAIGLDGTIYVGSDDGYLYATYPDGRLKWTFRTGSSVYSSPAIASDGTIYVGSEDGYLYAIYPDGRPKWTFGTGFAVHSSPVIASDGMIYVGSDGGYLYAIYPDGRLKWTFRTGSSVYSSPAIASDGTIYVGSVDKNLYAINPDGSLKWKYQTGYWVGSSPAIASDGTIYVGSVDKNLYAINPNGSRKWRYRVSGWVVSSPVISLDGTIYVGSVDHSLYAINPNGSLKWKYQTGYWIGSSPAITSDGTIYVGSADNYLYAIGGGVVSPDFSISTSPSSQSVTQGNSTGYTITLTAQNGFNSEVFLSATDLPTGVTSTFNPSSLTPTNSSTLTVSTSSSTPTGTCTITITASGGGKTHTATVTLNVQPASHNMHITSPAEGATITTSSFAVSGTFDSAPGTSNFKLVVTVGADTHTYNFTATGTTWGPVIVNMADFPSMVIGGSYTATLQASTQALSIPPYQTGVRTITWNPSNVTFFTLHIPSGWSLISVPFDTSATTLSCPLIYYFNGSAWLPETATLHPGRGYLVLSTTPASRDVILTGTPLSSPFSLPSPGSWQLIGNPFASPCTLSSTSPILLIYFFNSTTSTWQPADVNNLQPGMGYLVLTPSPGTFTFTINP